EEAGKAAERVDAHVDVRSRQWQLEVGLDLRQRLGQRLLVSHEGRHALRQRRVWPGQVHARRQVAGVEGGVLVRSARILQPEQLAVDHRQYVVALESAAGIQLVIGECGKALPL